MENEEKRTGVVKTAAVCGLYCKACTLYIASTEDPERLTRLAARFQLTEDDVKCFGCRSHKRFPACAQCTMSSCATERGIAFCSECTDYPCEELTTFQSAMPHRIELWDDLKSIKADGCEAWHTTVQQRYTCPKCHSINSAYDLTCRTCGAEPSCAYVADHKDAIETFLASR
jgi:hypothetical protein